MKCYAIEYFIKENEKDEKISEVKLYRANKNGGTFKFASKPIYCDRDKFVEIFYSILNVKNECFRDKSPNDKLRR